MIRFDRRALPLGLIAALGAAPAHADVTPDQVWSDFRSYLEGFGYQVSGSEAATGGTLTVSDVTMTVQQAEEPFSVVLSIDSLVLTDQGDGSVSVAFPAVMPIVMKGTDEDGAAVQVGLEFRQSGLDMRVTGTPAELVYSYTAASMGMALADLMAEGKVIPPEQAALDMTINGVSGGSTVTVGDLRRISQTMSGDSATITAAFDDPESGARGSIEAQMNALDFTGTSSLPPQMDTTQMDAMLRAGFALDGTLSWRDASSRFSVMENGAMTEGQTQAASTLWRVSMGDGGLDYSGVGQSVTYSLSGGELPFPVAVAADETRFAMTLPLVAGPAEQDFALGLTLGGMTISDGVWNLFDPGTILPRDPATLAIDLAGKAKMFVDLLNPEAMERAENAGEVPGELNALTLKGLTLRAAGAELTGTGDFTFDNTDLTTFDGVPRPIGSFNLNLTGANALIDKLIQMGLVSEDDAMGARMMMSMFAVPGNGDDALTSTIEINEQGHILANGMRIQ